MRPQISQINSPCTPLVTTLCVVTHSHAERGNEREIIKIIRRMEKKEKWGKDVKYSCSFISHPKEKNSISFLPFPPFSILLNLFLLFFVSLWLIMFLFITGFAEERTDKLPIPIKAVPKQDRENLKKIIDGKTAFLNWRDEEIETTDKLFDYLFDKPILTTVILTELGIAQYQFESHDSYYLFDDGSGLSGELKMLYKRDRERVYQGAYLYTTGAGIPVRLTGEWVLILKYQMGKEMLTTDIDLYLKSDEDRLSKITKDLPFILKAIMLEKVNSYIESVRGLCELIQSDPEDVYERLKESGEISEKDLREFKKRLSQTKIH